jgi:flagellin-like protein
MNKKGISPVVSTLLLIVFAAVLGIVVMSWGKAAQFEEEAEPASCEDAGVGIISIAGEPQVCHADGILKYTLENTGNSQIESLKISIIADEIEIVDEQKLIMAADIVNLESRFTTKTDIKKIKFTPRITIDGRAVFCPIKGAEIENIKECR